jgi:hypothetical protein
MNNSTTGFFIRAKPTSYCFLILEKFYLKSMGAFSKALFVLKDNLDNGLEGNVFIKE